MRKRLAVLIALLVTVGWVLMGCGAKEKAPNSGKASESASQVAFTLGTVAQLTVHGPDADEAVSAVIQELDRLTAALDRFTPDSEVHRVNTAGGEWVEVGSETFGLTQAALELAELTGGAFDPTVAPLIDLWGFVEDPNALPDENDSPTVLVGQRPPEDEAIQSVLQRIGYQMVELDADGSKIRLDSPRAELDFGAIAKGYAADRAVAILRERGIASGLVDLGGDMFALGSKPDGTPWRVGIAHPREPGALVAVIPVEDRAIVTSGDYERYFEYEGVRYTHLVDPRTGYPQHELASVTVVATKGTEADALATAVAVMGIDEGLALLESLPGVDGLLIGTDGRIEMTSGLRDRIQLRGVDF